MNQILSKLPKNTFASRFIPFASNLMNKYPPVVPMSQNYMYLDKFKAINDNTFMNISLYRFNNNKQIDHYVLDIHSNDFVIKEMLMNKKTLDYKLFYNNKTILELYTDYNNIDLDNIYSSKIKNIIYRLDGMKIEINYTITK